MLPYIDETRKSRMQNEEFLGIRRKSRISERESYDSYNLTNDDYPILSTRKPRGKLGMTAVKGKVLTMLGGEGIAVLSHEAGELYFTYDNGTRYTKKIGTYDASETYHLIRMGARIVCYPKCYVYNTANGKAELFDTSIMATDGVVIENCVARYNEETGYTMTSVTSYYDKKNPEGYSLKVDETQDADGNKTIDYKIMDGNEEWKGDTFIKISGLDIREGDTCHDVNLFGFGEQGKGAFQWKTFLSSIGADDYKQGNFVYISGLTCQLKVTIVDNGKGAEISRAKPAEDLSGKTTLVNPEGFAVTYRSNFRRFDHIVECKNRLWACLYDGKVNEIYATRLGSFSDWSISEVASESGYAASVGSYGGFTGACVYGDNPIFFKEDFVHKVYVASSGAHQIYNVPCRGVEAGSSASIAELGGYLYYKARGGFVRFDGSGVAEISEPIEGGRYRNAVAGIEGEKYVVGCTDRKEDPYIFVFDTRYGTWQREHTESAVKYMEEYRGRMCIADGSGILYHELREGDEPEEKHVRYMYESGDIGFSDMEKKYICRLEARVRLELGASFNVWIQYDSDGRWISLRRAVGERCTPKVDTVHVMPRRCDHFRLRITGKGEMKLYGITRVYEEGESV